MFFFGQNVTEIFHLFILVNITGSTYSFDYQFNTKK